MLNQDLHEIHHLNYNSNSEFLFGRLAALAAQKAVMPEFDGSFISLQNTNSNQLESQFAFPRNSDPNFNFSQPNSENDNQFNPQNSFNQLSGNYSNQNLISPNNSGNSNNSNPQTNFDSNPQFFSTNSQPFEPNSIQPNSLSNNNANNDWNNPDLSQSSLENLNQTSGSSNLGINPNFNSQFSNFNFDPNQQNTELSPNILPLPPRGEIVESSIKIPDNQAISQIRKPEENKPDQTTILATNPKVPIPQNFILKIPKERKLILHKSIGWNDIVNFFRVPNLTKVGAAQLAQDSLIIKID